ncbi:carbohydrate ABC transporter substrate-binding protein, CUT1 family [Halobacillus alkaliphilus]|uniref:Carbohydrate ABC transporter substrate-binding protein, CUT1 family n=1 Tax=Halobacillus alkaliphilus TaxID=396056 RepID=A0A1I2KQD8_9BACI|nr:ABC transporter substrate-binding protein [Halobacillus alkaliphilus]SFF67437.1 carbohydrate ABC transporter substrate-binding protein, CUT1 family [Halobacillus alkaliphilus]
MRGNKWFAALGISSLLLGSALAGCSNSEESSSQTNSDGKTVVELNGWGSSPEEEELLKETITAFEEEHPNIQIKHEVIADQYMDVIKTRLIGGEAADVFYLDALDAPSLMQQDVLEPLNDYMTEDFDVGDFEDPLVNAFKSGGTHYGFPKDFSTLALFYDKQAFEEAGLEGPPENWEELREYAEKLTVDEDGDGTPERYGLGFAKELARQFYKFQPYGGKLVTEDGKAAFANEKSVEALKPIVDMYKNEKTAGLPSDVGAGFGGDMFGQQKAAMVIEGNWTIPFLENNFPDVDYGTSELPAINGEKATAAFTVAYVMNKNSEVKDAAWEFIEFMTGKEGMEIWTSKGFALPTRKSVADKLGYADDGLRSSFVEGASYAQPWQAGENLPIIMNNFDNQFVSALLGEQTLEEALKKAEDTANNEISSSN